MVVAGCDGQVWEAVWAAGTCGRLVRCGRRVEAGLCEGVRSVKSQLCGVWLVCWSVWCCVMGERRAMVVECVWGVWQFVLV